MLCRTFLIYTLNFTAAQRLADSFAAGFKQLVTRVFLVNTIFFNRQFVLGSGLVVNKCSHPAIPDIEEGAEVTTHVRVMVVVVRHVVHAFEQPVL